MDGPLKGFYDCHLDDDVILIYKPIGNGACKLFAVCTHADLTGPKAKIFSRPICAATVCSLLNTRAKTPSYIFEEHAVNAPWRSPTPQLN